MKKILQNFQSNYFIFQNVPYNSFVNNDFTSLFTYKNVKKGDYLFNQNCYAKGLYFIENGEYELTTSKLFDELDSFQLEMENCLDVFPEYISSIQKSSIEVENVIKMCRDPLYKTPEFEQYYTPKNVTNLGMTYSKNQTTCDINLECKLNSARLCKQHLILFML